MGLFDGKPLTREEMIEANERHLRSERAGEHDKKGRTTRHRPWHEIAGPGPAEKTCGDCASLVTRGRYFKCGEFEITAGPGTDIRKKDPACRLFQEKTGGGND